MRIVTCSILTFGWLALAACDGSSSVGAVPGAGSGGGTGGAGSSSSGAGLGGTIGAVSKVDVVLAIDNSASMSDKQEVLALAMTDLVNGLSNPPCIDAAGHQTTMPSPADVCPDGSARPYAPVVDIHLGVVSSSLGGHGGDYCQTGDPQFPDSDDRAHLLTRGANGTQVQTYEQSGFLAWDPLQQADPPGEANVTAFADNVRSLVLGVGQVGCGFESQLESWYRFLVDPDPPKSVEASGGTSVAIGTDKALLAQRAAFLRPDSLLVILQLTDENDCSIKDSGYGYFTSSSQPGGFNTMPPPTKACAADPNDKCCYSCGFPTGPAGCSADNRDPCKGGALLSVVDDNINLRCFDQKRRFGMDMLYPVDRYVTGLTSPTVADRDGNVVRNPLYSDLTGSGATVRDPGLVVYAGILGVPWQDVARNKNDITKGVKSFDELNQSDANGHSGWDIILGDPNHSVPPLDPLMIETFRIRSGNNPVLGVPIAPPSDPLGNPINGNDYTIADKGDLQYACIVPITPRDCTNPSGPSCDCIPPPSPGDPYSDSPLCAPNPGDGGHPTLQVYAKSYPGLRELEVLKGIGSQGVVESICPTNITDATQPDYAYRPALRAILDHVKGRLAP